MLRALTEQVDQRITSLSGGQRKRTSFALELLTAVARCSSMNEDLPMTGAPSS
ncbi:MAG: hypothetical protein ACRDRU_26480 [Pseudonocardiaceae bacterium]